MQDEEKLLAAARLNYEALSADASKRIDYQVGYAEQGLKGLMLVNGGAIVALFTFIGNEAPVALDTVKVWWAFRCFSAGIVFTLSAYFAAFFSQGQYYLSSQYEAWNWGQKMLTGVDGNYKHKRPFRIGKWCEVLGAVAALAALVAFIAGASFALKGVLPA
ncbi:hypothetical protein [Pedomonas sp. V897]|uniref:hypothetical protein n=1 Tax=Pedomonas sp. V897 TaxID=3446482 RepID=UPI003EDFED94